MNVLVLNCGSSSAKFAVIDSESGRELISGIAQRVGSDSATLDWKMDGTKRTREHEADGSILFTALHDLSLYDGMHVVLRPAQMSAEEMQGLVLREYRRFYSTWRVVTAALSGAFLRFRRLGSGQRAYVREARGIQRLRRWMRLHVEYKFAPVAFRATGWARIRSALRDPEYTAYLARVRDLGQQ